MVGLPVVSCTVEVGTCVTCWAVVVNRWVLGPFAEVVPAVVSRAVLDRTVVSGTVAEISVVLGCAVVSCTVRRWVVVSGSVECCCPGVVACAEVPCPVVVGPRVACWVVPVVSSEVVLGRAVVASTVVVGRAVVTRTVVGCAVSTLVVRPGVICCVVPCAVLSVSVRCVVLGCTVVSLTVVRWAVCSAVVVACTVESRPVVLSIGAL